MPRPTDHYTHDQFEPIESDFQGETVRCLHCKHWTGSVKTLNRKKDHLLKCQAYQAWRAAGNGQDLAPPNKYTKRDSSAMDSVDPYSSPYDNFNNSRSQQSPALARSRVLDVGRHFHETFDNDATQKCIRTRCKHCGFVRAKNTTRQYEHLQSCSAFLNTNEGQQAVTDGLLQQPAGEIAESGGQDIFRGTAPNPSLTFPRKGIRGQYNAAKATPTRPAVNKPSLVNYLLSKLQQSHTDATQHPFLSHAGCGTLSAVAVEQYLTQQGYISRAMATFIGSLIGKIRLDPAKKPEDDTYWRTFDLLASCINNAKRELEFLRTTKEKYNLLNDDESPRHATKGLLDLMESASAPSANLLEGMLVLWAIEHLHLVSWSYADSFHQPGAPTSTSYSVPTYYHTGQYDLPGGFGQGQQNGGSDNLHTTAMYEALIPNWTSIGFSKFVDACKAIVDELANASTGGNGSRELHNSEDVLAQIVWLWKQMWPDVTGMGEEDDTVENGEGPSQTDRDGGQNDNPIEIQDDDDMARDEDAPIADSPYGGTGLEAVAAANRAVS